MLYCVICDKPLDYDTSNPVDGDTVLCACGALVVVCVADKVEYMTFVYGGKGQRDEYSV